MKVYYKNLINNVFTVDTQRDETIKEVDAKI